MGSSATQIELKIPDKSFLISNFLRRLNTRDWAKVCPPNKNTRNPLVQVKRPRRQRGRAHGSKKKAKIPRKRTRHLQERRRSVQIIPPEPLVWCSSTNAKGSPRELSVSMSWSSKGSRTIIAKVPRRSLARFPYLEWWKKPRSKDPLHFHKNTAEEDQVERTSNHCWYILLGYFFLSLTKREL